MEGTKGIDIINRNKKFYTEKGVEALETRAKTLITLFNNNKFPIHQDVFGFGKLNIEDSLECLARITELLFSHSVFTSITKTTSVQVSFIEKDKLE